MKYFRLMPYLIGAALFSLMACNDATVIGSDLVSGEELDVEFTDTITFHTYSSVEDTVSVYNFDQNLSFENYPFGNFNDPVFGTSTASIYSQVTTQSAPPDFTGKTFDSLVLILPYNTSGFYGDTSEMYSLQVWEIEESMSEMTSYNSEDEFALGEIIGEADFMTRTDSFSIYRPADDTIIRVQPQLRIPLDVGMFGEGFFEAAKADSTLLESSENFREFFQGFHLKPVSTNGGMVNFDLRGVTSDDNIFIAGIKVYYHEGSDFFEYLFPIFNSQIITSNFQHDYAGSVAESFLGENAEGSDSLLFVQAMSGINVVIEFPYLEDLSDRIINEAILEFPVVSLPGDNDDLYFPVNQLLLSQVSEDGERVLIDDILFTRNTTTFISDFGGIPLNDTYRMNISAYLQDAMRGLVNNKLELFISLKPEKSQRVVLAGPKHGIAPAKLNVTFTNF